MRLNDSRGPEPLPESVSMGGLPPQRDDWMLGGDDLQGFLTGSNSSSSRSKRETERQEAKVKAEQVHPRELNPSLRAASGYSTNARPSSYSSSSSSSWQRMLVQKSLDRVNRGEARLEDVVRERFGSMEEFEAACREAGISLSAFQRAQEKSSEIHEIKTRPPVTHVEEVPAEDLNRLMARKMKAEMQGDYELARRLEESISKAQKSAPQQSKIQLNHRDFKSRGPVSDDATISKMVEHERLAPTHELDEELARRIAKTSRFSDRRDGMEEFSDRFGEQRTRPEKRRVSDVDESRKRMALSRCKKQERIEAACWFCLDSDRSDPGLIIARGHHIYLALPKYGQLEPLHCLLVPMEHVPSLLQSGDQEAVWTELRNFKKCLLQMAAQQGRRMLFLEAAMGFEESRHAFIDCISVTGEGDVDPAGAFKKALLECDAEWSQHKRLFDTTETASGGLRKAIPRHFPYLYVDFRLDQGYAHVVEDEERVGPGFLRGIAAGLLGLEPGSRKDRPTGETTVKQFISLFKPFDWTPLLHKP